MSTKPPDNATALVGLARVAVETQRHYAAVPYSSEHGAVPVQLVDQELAGNCVWNVATPRSGGSPRLQHIRPSIFDLMSPP